MAPCGWTVVTCGCGTCWDTHTPAVRARAQALAALVIWSATGRRYGLCPVTVQPCNPSAAPPLYQVYPVDYGDDSGGYYPTIEGGEWVNECGPGCTCHARCEVALDGPTTTARVTQVTVAGAVVPPAAYQVHNGYLLVRIDGQCWPTCTDYGSQAPPGFTVTYTRGEPIPTAIQGAFERLACEFATACSGSECALPARLASLTRQGVEVTVNDQPEWEDMIRTGIPEVDAAIAADNPYRRYSPPAVFTPDIVPARVVT